MICCGWPLRSSIVNLSLPRTPSRECQSSIRVASAGAATGAGVGPRVQRARGNEQAKRRLDRGLAGQRLVRLCGGGFEGRRNFQWHQPQLGRARRQLQIRSCHGHRQLRSGLRGSASRASPAPARSPRASSSACFGADLGVDLAADLAMVRSCRKSWPFCAVRPMPPASSMRASSSFIARCLPMAAASRPAPPPFRAATSPRQYRRWRTGFARRSGP